MADAGLFVGWGTPVRGREARSLDVFEEAVGYWTRLQQEGVVESFDIVLLDLHGGDLSGFFLLKGSAESLAALRADDEFARIISRASLVVDNLGVVGAVLGDGIPEQMGRYQEAISELA